MPDPDMLSSALANPLPGFCTNVLPGGSWHETRRSLSRNLPLLSRALREEVLPPGQTLPLDLWLSAATARELLEDAAAVPELVGLIGRAGAECTMINGFPFGAFHGRRVKERVYLPDWTDPERLAHTQRLFEILHRLAPPGRALSVSTLPGSHKSFVADWNGEAGIAIRDQLRDLADWLDERSATWGRDCHLGLEPEPFGLFEDLGETLGFFEFLRAGAGADRVARLNRHLGLNYDCCHFALQFAEAGPSLDALVAAGIRLSKVHLSHALELDPREADPVEQLGPFDEPVYLHQVMARLPDGRLERCGDLPEALANASLREAECWRIHFHVPLHAEPEAPLRSTAAHLDETLAWLAAHPGACGHLAMETYTWAVLPQPLRPASPVDMLAAEYRHLHGVLAALPPS